MSEPRRTTIDDRLPMFYRATIDELFGRNCVLEVEVSALKDALRAAREETDSLADLVRLLLMPQLSDAQLKRKVKHLQHVVERIH